MKRLNLLVLIILFLCSYSNAQVAISTSSALPDASAMLDISSTTKGLLIPRLSSLQRMAIPSPADGLMVYDINTVSPWYYKAGTGWVQIASAAVSLTLPYAATGNAASSLFYITNSGSGAGLEGDNSSSNSSAFGVLGTITSTSPGSYSTAVRGINNGTGGLGIGVWGSQNGSGWGVYGTSVAGYGVYGTSSSSYAVFANSIGSGTGLYAQSNTGVAANFAISNSSNASNVLNLTSDGNGTVLNAITSGIGNVATMSNNNSSSTANTLNVVTIGPGVIADHSLGNAGNFFYNNSNGVGAGVRGEVNSIFGNNGTAGVYGVSSGTGGYGGYFEHSNSAGFGIALEAITNGLGVAGHFETSQSANAQTTLEAFNSGTGSTFTANNFNSTNTSNTLNVTTVGLGVIPDHSLGNAGNFFTNNTNGVGAGVRGEVNSIFGNNGTAGVYGVSSGTGGYGGYFEHSNPSGYGIALQAVTNGQGVVGHFETLPATNAQTTLETLTGGTGSAFTATNYNSANISNILSVVNNGPGVIADHSQGNAGNFFMNNTSGVGAGVRGEVNSIFGNNGTAGVYGVSSGTGGYAGYFEHTETTGYGITLEVISHDQGTAMVVDQEGGGDISIFQTGGSNKARIDNTGKGFFDGGTQFGGADLAESFSVEGNRCSYEPGDVLIISTQSDRTLEKSNTAYSILVAGVYATKPGVLLTEKNMCENIDNEVPLGVVGVIPTKVCNQNGAIKRGDILVTSDKIGYAMKADLDKLKTGQAIGKALENFDGTNGKIKVLVNVK